MDNDEAEYPEFGECRFPFSTKWSGCIEATNESLKQAAAKEAKGVGKIRRASFKPRSMAIAQGAQAPHR